MDYSSTIHSSPLRNPSTGDHTSATSHSQLIKQLVEEGKQFRVDPFKQTAVSTVIQTNGHASVSHSENPLSSLHVQTNSLNIITKNSGFVSPTHKSKVLISQKENSGFERPELLSPEIFATRKKTDALLRSIVVKYGLDSTEETTNPSASTNSNLQRPALSTVTDSYANQHSVTDSLNVQTGDKVVFVSPMKVERTQEINGHTNLGIFRSPEESAKKASAGLEHRFLSPNNIEIPETDQYRHSFDAHIKPTHKGYSENKRQNRFSETDHFPGYGSMARSHVDRHHFYSTGPKITYSRVEDGEVAFNRFFNEIMATVSPQNSLAASSYPTTKKSFRPDLVRTVESKPAYLGGGSHSQQGNTLSRFVSPDIKEEFYQSHHHERGDSHLRPVDVYTRPYDDGGHHVGSHTTTADLHSDKYNHLHHHHGTTRPYEDTVHHYTTNTTHPDVGFSTRETDFREEPHHNRLENHVKASADLYTRPYETAVYHHQEHQHRPDHEGLFQTREREIIIGPKKPHVEEADRRAYRMLSEEDDREQIGFSDADVAMARQFFEHSSPKRSIPPIQPLKKELVTFGPESDREEVKHEEIFGKQTEKNVEKDEHKMEKKVEKIISELENTVVHQKSDKGKVYTVVFAVVVLIFAWLAFILMDSEEEGDF